MSNLQLQIAVIDDGINEELYKIGELKSNIQITPELDIYERVGYDPFMPSHGTTCAAIIKKYAPDAVLSSVKILNDDSHRGMKAQLIRALEWCVENKIRLVNLSLGTIDYRDFVEVEKASKYASENGVIIVAACNNRNIFTCPASLENIIGVNCDKSEELKEREYIYNSIAVDGIEITACGSHKLERYSGESKVTSACNSFATPMVTALAYGIIKNNPSICLNELKEALKRKAVKPNYIKPSQPENSQRFCYFNEESTEAPILAVYNYCEKKSDDFSKKLTDRFRIDGYNAVATYRDESEKDLCNGRVDIKSYVASEKSSFKESIQRIFNIYDPDIIIVPINMIEDNQLAYAKEIESDLDIDIKIYMYETLKIEVTSTNEAKETKIFTFLNDYKIDDLYNYILSIFDTYEE